MQKRVAIVGYSFRLPGVDPDSFWSNLEAGRDLVSRVPDDRWARESFLHPRKSEPGASYTFAAGTLGDVSGFDAAFFGISPREAEQMDPQQRLLLELTWEAFERGGIRPSSVRGSRGAVYIGFSGSDYSYRRADDMASIDASTMTGNTGSIAANRISYQFDLRGPSMAVDTACSSSLVAFHQACQSIRSGESSLAVVGGVSLHLHPFAFIGFSKASMLSRRGLCNVFDAAGDGYVRSEGAGIFVLKDLDAAMADGDKVFAVVEASGVNCDGRTNGLTVPGCETQAALLRELYADAGIDPAEVDYVEAHGTGTAVGDPIETRAIGLALGEKRPPDAPLLIGSVKSNLGHLETASGIAGLAKALYCLEHRSVPPTIHLASVNPNIRLDEWNLAVVTRNTALAGDRPLVIGVNSFGFGGANAHVILRSAAPVSARTQPVTDGAPLQLSARSPEALRELAGEYAAWLRAHPDVPLYDVAYNAMFRRDAHSDRVAAPVADRAVLVDALEAFAGRGDDPLLAHGIALGEASRPVFVYSGNGSQWVGMGQGLLDTDAVFREAVDRVDSLFQRHGDFSLVAELRAAEGADRFALTEVAQPTLFAIQVGITELLRHRGIQAAAVVGHSVGEVAAAWACGALSLEQAVRVIAARSAQQGTTRGLGGMTAVGLGAEAVDALLDESGLAGRLVLAGINSPRGVTVAGDLEALQTFERRLAEREVFQRRLKLDYAFHSPAMEPIALPLQQALQGLRPRSSSVPFYSTVTGNRLAGERLGPAYWWRNVREPVQFEGAVNALISHGFNLFVEVGPSAILRNYVSDCLRQQGVDGRVVPTMLRDDDSPAALQQTLLQLLVAGAPLELDRLFPRARPLLDIPTYPWQHERYWHPVTVEGQGLIERRKVHPLLGYRLHEPEAEWENQLDTDLYPNLRDHRVGDAVVVPAAAFVDMALAAAHAWQEGAAQELEELEIRAPLLLEDNRTKTVRLRIDATDGSFVIRSRDRLSQDPWLVNAVGRLLGTPAGAVPGRYVAPAGKSDVPGDEHYRLAAGVGLEYGPAFRAVADVWCQPDGVSARLVTPSAIVHEVAAARLHPAFLDGCFQLLVDALRDELTRHAGIAFVPIKVGSMVLWRPGAAPGHAHTRIVRRGPRSIVAECLLCDAAGDAIAELREVRFRALPLRRRQHAPTDFLAYEAVPRPRAADQPSAPLPALDDLVAIARARLHTPQRSHDRAAYYREVEPLLDVLCAAFAEHALRAIVADDAPVDVERLIAGGAVSAQRAGLLNVLVGMLEEDGVLEPTDTGWRWAPDSGLPAPADVWISLLGDYPDYAAELLMVGRVGMHLNELLAGKSDAAGLPAPRCSSAMLAHYTAGSPSVVDLHGAVARIVAGAIERLPAGRRLRVLEWCACRSQLTAQILPVVDFDRCDYLLAAPAVEVLDDREPLLEHYPGVQTAVWTSLESAGLGSDSDQLFDLVLLPAVELDPVQADRLLARLQHHLAVGGLVLLIGQYPARWTDLVFGLQVGEGADSAERLPGGMRSPSAWQSLAARHGLVRATTVHDLPEIESGGYLMLLGNGRERSEVEPLSPPPTAWVLLHDAEGYGAALANAVGSELRALGHEVVSATPGNQFTAMDSGFALNPASGDQVATLLAAVREVHGEVHGVVNLVGVPAVDENRAPEAVLVAQERRCMSALAMWRACEQHRITPNCWLVTVCAAKSLLPADVRAALDVRPGDADDAPLWGLGRTAMNEFPDLPIRLVDCADPQRLERMAAGLLAELLDPDAEDEVILTAAGRYAPRLRTRPLPPLPGVPADAAAAAPVARLDFSQPGPLKHLAWHQAQPVSPGTGEVAIDVCAAGLNFRDVMYAMGLLSDEAVESGFAGPTLGMELSGVVSEVGPGVVGLQPGDEVIAFAPASLATRAVTTAGAVVRKPAGWSFEAAATVPTTFFTVYYALHHLANLREGERILIHGAAGGVGIAAIQLAKLTGAEIFATAGSPEKRDVVRMLGADHVLDSRSLAFADEILALTGGEGVDVVLNSLAGEAINRNLRVLRPFGRFLELGKRDFYENTRIGLRPFRNNIAYFGIDADQLMHERPDLTRRLFSELMGLFNEGMLKPLPFRAFPAGEVVDAFRYMQQSRQIGKVVISFRNGMPAALAPDVQGDSLRLRADASYVVTGGLGGFGLRTAQWLAERGARHLVLIGRRGLATPEAQAAVDALQAAGVTVRVEACDVTRRKALAAVLQDIDASMPPLRGVVHAAMVLADGLLRNLDDEAFHKVLAPKVLGARHLHDLTRDRSLDFFVMYSSATTLFGNPGQGNYVAANLYLEALAEVRRAQGLPAVCLSWGAIDDVGYLARHQDVKEALQGRMGGAALRADEALQVLEQALLRDCSGLGVMDLDWPALRRFLPTAGAPRFIELARRAEEIGGDAEGLAEIRRLVEELAPEELQEMFIDLLRREVAEILRISPERLDPHRSMYDQGMDSLMGMELVAAVETRFGVNLPIMALSEGPTIARLVDRIIRQLKAPEAETGEPASGLHDQVRSMAARHVGDVDAGAIDEVAAVIEEQSPVSAGLLDRS